MAQTQDILVIPIEGDLDVVNAPKVRSLIERKVRIGCKRVIINLADATYVDSTGMAVLLTGARMLYETGGLLSVVNVCESVYRSLVICRLVDIIPVSSTAPKPPIPALDPNIRPLWSGTMSVDPAKMATTRRRIEEVLERSSELSANEIFDLTLAGGEALGNAIDHTSAEGVLCSLEVYPDRVIVEVSDCGTGLELAPGEPVPPSECASELERGRGIKLMRMLADSVEISRKPDGCGTVVRLVKLITTQYPQAASQSQQPGFPA